MALSSSRPHHLLRPLLRGFHASAQALARAEPHEFSKPSGYLGSWEPAGEPREAWARLDRLRKGYARDVQKLRREYAYEVQLMEAERQRKAEARAEAARVANEERKAAKAAAAQTRAAERRAFEEDFRQALVRFPSLLLPSLFATAHNLFDESPHSFGLLNTMLVSFFSRPWLSTFFIKRKRSKVQRISWFWRIETNLVHRVRLLHGSRCATW